MAQQHPQAAGSGQTIKADDLKFALAASKLRRHTGGRTCQLAVLTAGPVLRADCSHRNRLHSREDVQRHGTFKSMVTPLERGHMAEVVMRTRWLHGLAEVRKTWGTGIRTLLTEPRHVLNGGAA